MNFSLIAESIHAQLDGTVHAVSPAQPVVDALSYGMAPEGDARFLYVFEEKVPALSDSDNLCIMCLKKYLPDGAVNYIAFDKKEDLRKAAALAESYFAITQRLLRLAVSSVRDPGLQKTVDAATEILSNPMLVADPNRNIMAISDVEIEDHAWKRFKEERMLPMHPDNEHIEQMITASGESDPVTVVDGMHRKAYFIRVLLSGGGRSVGELQLFSEFHPFLPIDREYAEILGGILTADILGNDLKGHEDFGRSGLVIYD